MFRLLGLVAVYILTFLNNEIFAMKIESIWNCPDTEVNKIDGLIHEININLDGTFTGRLKVPFVIDESILFTTSVSTWSDGKWKKEAVGISGNICDALNNYIPMLWRKVADKVDVPQNCPIPAGDYILEKFAITPDDLDLPIKLPSNILMHSEFTKDGKMFLCQEMEISP